MRPKKIADLADQIAIFVISVIAWESKAENK